MLYFIANHKRATYESLAAAGLRYAFDGSPLSSVEVLHGPGFQPGVIVTNRPPDTVGNLRYEAALQRWQKRPVTLLPDVSAEVWVGWEMGTSPDPAVYLARPHQLDSHPVELADGKTWNVPIVQAFFEHEGRPSIATALPRLSKLADDGTWTMDEVRSEYAELHRYARAWWDQYASPDAQAADAFTFDDANNACVVALAHNYRVSAVEVSVLGLLDAPSRGRVLMAMIDGERLIEYTQKKTAAMTGGETTGEV